MGQDALDSVVVESAKGRRMSEGGVDVFGGVACTQEQDLASLMARGGLRTTAAHQSEKLAGALPHVGESDLELVQVHGALALGLRVKPGGIELEPLSTTYKLVTGDTFKISRVDEELALGNADRENVCHMVIGHRIPVAVPINEAVDPADPIDDTGGV